MKLESLRIPSGKYELACLRYLPEKPRGTALIFAHGFTSGKYSLDGLASYLAHRGYEGLTFDCVGHKLGGSTGEMKRIRDAADNFQDALHWLRANTKAEHIVLVGHSLGGITALQVAADERRKIPLDGEARLEGIVSLCAGIEPSKGFESGIGKTMLEQRSDYITGAPAKKLLQELDKLAESVQDITEIPVLFVAARQDVLVSVERVEALAVFVGTNATVAVVDTSHLETPDRARGLILNWLEARGL